MNYARVAWLCCVVCIFASVSGVQAQAKRPAATSEVEPGRTSDFGFARSAKKVGDAVHLSFDRADLLTGKKAIAYSRARGMGDDVPNDYIIANDNPKLRNLVLAPSCVITGTGILANGSTNPRPVTLAAFVAAVKKYDEGIPVNITYDRERRVVKIAEQFFP